jgi:hypothetical protein
VSVTNQAPGYWHYYQVVVPADTNLLGWDLRLTNVTAGNPELVVGKDALPLELYTTPWPPYDLPSDYGTWPGDYQWLGGQDWTGESDNPNGSYANVSMLAMGLGNPLQPGTYYVGVSDPNNNTDSYTLVSRGIGLTNYSLPVVALNWANGAVTNTNLVPREAAYYSVQIPSNTPSWHVRLAPTVGDALLLVQRDYLPNVAANAYPSGSAAYPNASGYLPSGGIKMEKAGNEHYLLLPQNGQTNIPAGTYYLGVVGQGVNPSGNQIGSNTTSYVLQSLGSLPVINLGTAGTNDLVITNNLAAGLVEQLKPAGHVCHIEQRNGGRAGNEFGSGHEHSTNLR